MQSVGRVSVIITTCKGTKKLVRAIESVRRQSYLDIEIIVVDDNGLGTDEQLKTQNMIQCYIDEQKIHYIVHDINKNGAAARNTGLNYSTGEYVAFLDDDDFFLPERCKILVDILNSSGCGMAYSDVIFLNGSDLCAEMKCRKQGFSQAEMLIDQSLLGTGSNLFMKKTVAEKINGFDESFLRYQDVEFMIRALASNSIIGVNKCLVVKDSTDNRFYPKFVSFIISQEHLLSTFQYELSLLNEQDRNICYESKRKELILSAYQSRKSANIRKAWRLYKRDCPNAKRSKKFKIKLRGLCIRFCPNLLIKASKRKSAKKRDALVRNIDKQTLSDLNFLIGCNL